MSTDWTAHVIIGCRVPATSLYETVTTKHERHDYPTDARYCPVCGDPIETQTARPLYDKDTTTIDGVALVFDQWEESVIVGHQAVTACSRYGDSWTSFSELPDLEILKRRVRKALEPLDLWNESTFGLHAVLHCSY